MDPLSFDFGDTGSFSSGDTSDGLIDPGTLSNPLLSNSAPAPAASSTFDPASLLTSSLGITTPFLNAITTGITGSPAQTQANLTASQTLARLNGSGPNNLTQALQSPQSFWQFITGQKPVVATTTAPAPSNPMTWILVIVAIFVVIKIVK